MKDEKIERLIEKYKAGDSTLPEEQFLFDNAENSNATVEAWSTFIKHNKKEAPEDFNDALWESFQNKKPKNRRLLISLMSAAAAVLLLVALFIGKPAQEKLSYKEKEAFLNEALNMITNAEQVDAQQNIIYDNELIVIYTSSE